jgi:RNA polymerase sigma factor (TIGR02999 family)
MEDQASAGGVTKLLQLAAAGDAQAGNRLAPLVLDELRRIAQKAMAKERQNHTLQPTLLADEAFVRLVGNERIDWSSQSQFYGYAAKAIGQILVDYARAHNAEKRGGGRDRVGIDTMDYFGDSQQGEPVDVENLVAALDELRTLNERHARVVELKFYFGKTVPQIAQMLGVSRRLVDSDWAVARRWLQDRLSEHEAAE